MKRLLAIYLLLLSAPIWAKAEGIDFYRVNLATIVAKMQEMSGEKYWYSGPESDTFSVNCPEEAFLDEAAKVLLSQGYFLSPTAYGVFVLKGRKLATELPAGYFSSHTSPSEDYSSVVYEKEEEPQSAEIERRVYEIGRKDRCKVQKAYLSGFIREAKTGEPQIGVSVSNSATGEYATSDIDGHYRILLPVGMNSLELSGYGLSDMNVMVEIYEDGTLDLKMKEKVFSISAAIVNAESSNAARNTNKMGVDLVRIESIKKMPAVLGEADVIKAVLTLPGVKSVGEASSGFNVRGGAADQNLVLYNQGTIYNTSHLFGLFSAFNSDVIKDVELYKSSIPAQYGGRISSVLDISGREGGDKKISTNLGLGLLTSHITAEGPLSGSTRFVLGARGTYSDWILGLLPQGSGYSNGTASFYDMNLSLTQKIGQKNSLSFSAYASLDDFSFARDTSYNYKNINASLRWRSDFSSKTSMNLSVGYDHYDYTYSERYIAELAKNTRFGIEDIFARLNFTSTPNNAHKISYGANVQIYNVNPGETEGINDDGSYIGYADVAPGASASYVENRKLPDEKALEAALYLSDSWTINRWLSADVGLRWSLFRNNQDGSVYQSPELRFSTKALAGDNFSFKAGFNSGAQYIQMLTNTVSISPTDTWKLCNSIIKPQKGYQASIGAYFSSSDSQVEMSLEGYYKSAYNSLDYKSGYSLLMNENIEEALLSMYSRAYGAEVMIKKPHGALNGWISYSYSRTELRNMYDEGIFNVNGGGWYPASYDKPHELKMVSNYKFSHRFSMSVNMDYSTGRPVTLPIARYYLSGVFRPVYGERNGYRIPDYFRTDVAFNVESSHYLKKVGYFSFTFGVYNVTGRKNAYSVYYKTTPAGIKGYMLTVFGCQIPYATVNLKF